MEEAWQRLKALAAEGGEDAPGLRVLLDESLTDLASALEELHVAEEELRQQNLELGDITVALAAERARYASLFKHAPDAYIVTDGAGIIQDANPAAALLGVPPGFVSGKPLANYVHSEQKRRFRAFVADLSHGDRTRLDEVTTSKPS